MNIPLIDLKAQYKSISEDLDRVTKEVLSSANYIMGKNVTEFEREFAEYIGVKHAISVGNGTDALVIALKSLGIGSGDEVITSTFTYFASAEAISAVGATPVFIDVEKETFNIDPAKIEERITKNTKAIIPVHIFGQSARMDEINTLAKKYDLKIVEDAAQAVGSKYKGKMIGALGDAACFSFFPTKNLSCAGDGGMIVTNDDNIAIVARALRTHGSGENGQKAFNFLNNIKDEVEVSKDGDDTVYNPLKYYNYLIGFNSRLDAIQAAILSVKLPHLDRWNARRREIAKIYDEKLKGSNVVTPIVDGENETIYHQYVLQCDNREVMLTKLKEKGIATGVYYPVPLHLQKVYKDLGYKEGDMPVSEYLANRTFAIPVYPELTEEEIEYIIEGIKE
ncbi:DegT/DnrJ/EryC1/StrS family aminotransferase [Clostridium sp.]|uniref:DegT/DnrJ/EryC1/StrS family aminotransferase n=1 Tax=Clostridium sp. TaxID=1506 RepID=UPI00285042F8|nr:DegT/DnrJ/EryC1/StrS family aminotransferase [Clostridium sp.]MDR3593315.1 DegT/DnrJ/EryC1/StrS family aminotransferase [Clostridium sp.]